MRYRQSRHDHFDLHRKDHSGRPALIAAAFLSSLGLWAVIIAAVARLV